MSTQQGQPLVSPQAYIQQQFGEACEELGVNPQETVLLCLFKFLQITPEDRGVHVAALKTDFNRFAGSADFEALQKTIDESINKVELQLYDALAATWPRPHDEPERPERDTMSGRR